MRVKASRWEALLFDTYSFIPEALIVFLFVQFPFHRLVFFLCIFPLYMVKWPTLLAIYNGKIITGFSIDKEKSSGYGAFLLMKNHLCFYLLFSIFCLRRERSIAFTLPSKFISAHTELNHLSGYLPVVR